MSETTLDFDEIIAAAREMAGLDDFGDAAFEEGLAVLIDTYNRSGFDEAAQSRNRARLVSLLVERLKIEQAFAEHPEIRDERIVAPVYLTGLPRTGTSALLNLLACDPGTRSMALWEGLSPSPLPGNPPKQEDHRYIAQVEFLTAVYEKNPEWGAIHHTSADTPEECIHLLNHTFDDVQFGVECLMEPYGSWFRSRDHRAAYAYYADLLRMLQWRRPGGGRFLLKSPAHLWAIDVLSELFNDSSFIITHRNPVESVGSYASMMESMMGGRSYDTHDLGPVVLDYLAAKMDHAMSCMDDMDPSRIIHVGYDDFVGDPVATAARIYDHFGMPLSDDLREVMVDHVTDHPRGEFGVHEYDLADYGLTPDVIEARFSTYMDRFDGYM